jgi:hypothetical protein
MQTATIVRRERKSVFQKGLGFNVGRRKSFLPNSNIQAFSPLPITQEGNQIKLKVNDNENLSIIDSDSGNSSSNSSEK